MAHSSMSFLASPLSFSRLPLVTASSLCCAMGMKPEYPGMWFDLACVPTWSVIIPYMTVLVNHGGPQESEHVKEQNRTGKVATSAFFHVLRVPVLTRTGP